MAVPLRFIPYKHRNDGGINCVAQNVCHVDLQITIRMNELSSHLNWNQTAGKVLRCCLLVIVFDADTLVLNHFCFAVNKNVNNIIHKLHIGSLQERLEGLEIMFVP